MGRNIAPSVECLPGIWKALGLIHNTAQMGINNLSTQGVENRFKVILSHKEFEASLCYTLYVIYTYMGQDYLIS